MTAPVGFYLEPVNSSVRPSPFPPRYLKRQIYKDPSVFQQVDAHAVNEARTNYRSFRDLIWNLIYSQNWNELERARAIFCWMRTKNLFTLVFDSELPGSPEQILSSFKDGKANYAKVFECLAVHSGLHCVTISGWAKGVNYKPGMPITKTPGNHMWNAIYIDGNWQLVDCHWATRYLQTEQKTPESLVYEYDDFYFLTEPSMLIYSHLPEEPVWQLLHPARSKLEYEEYPLVKSFFFSTGMQFLRQNRGLVFTKNGVATITLGFTQPSFFTYKLGFGDNSVENLQGIQLKRYVIQETTENRLTYYMRAPREGNYYLTVFSQPLADKIRTENLFKAACIYKIICDQASSDIRPYPLCSDNNWGAGAPLRQYGLNPSCKTAIVAAPRGDAEILFKKSRPVQLHAVLVRDGMDDDTLEKSVAVKEQDNQSLVQVRFPMEGEYGLEIYVNEPARDGETFTHVCQYLIACTDRDFGTVYGQVFDRADLAHGMQAPDFLYKNPGGQFVNPPAQGMPRHRPPGSVRSTASSQLDWDRGSLRDKPMTRIDDELSSRNGSLRRPPAGPTVGRTDSNYITGKNPQTLPPELLDRNYQKQKRYSGESEMSSASYAGDRSDIPSGSIRTKPQQDVTRATSPKKPLEIVYVSNVKEKQPVPVRKPQDNSQDNPKDGPIEIVYVSSKKSPKNSDSKGWDDDDTTSENPESPNPVSKGGRYEPVVVNEWPVRSARPGYAQDRDLPLKDTENSPRESLSESNPDFYFPRSKYGKDRPGGFGDDDDDLSPKLKNQGSFSGQPPFNQRQNPPRGYLEEEEDLPGGRVPGNKADYYYSRPNYGQDPGNDADDRMPRNNSQGSTTGQAPYNQRQTVVPIWKVPYSFDQGGNREGEYEEGTPTELDQEYRPHPSRMYTSSIAVQPPPSFKPIPVIHGSDVVPKPIPSNVPHKPFKDVSVFENVDIHAVEVSQEDHRSFRDLVWHLIYAREITNELEKARAIFLWLCSKDLAKLNFASVQRGSPEEILMNLQRGQTTYALVYEILCSYAGLHCKTISGYAKGVDYKPGMRFIGENGQHSWNAVLVNDVWRLVDCHWAARRLVGKKITPENVRYELDEYYFMPDPHQLIFTHFPYDVNWQLLERFLSLADFENLVPVKSAFFKYGLQILGHREAVIRTSQEVTIRVGCPPFKAPALAFTFTFAYENGKEDFHGIKMNRFGMQEMVENISYFTIRPPEEGCYSLVIFAKDLDRQTREGAYGGVCEYNLICTGNPGLPQPFPPCVQTSWGPSEGVSKYELFPLQKGSIFSTVDGIAEVRFRVAKALRFTAKLKSNDRDEKFMMGYLLQRLVGDMAIFTAYVPSPGEYGLEIYVNDPDVDGNSLYHVYQYLIICTEQLGLVRPLPLLPPGYLGPQPIFRQLGLVTSSHDDPYVQLDDGYVQIELEMMQKLRLTAQLIYMADNSTVDMSEYILQQGTGSKALFVLRLVKPGFYKFQLYGLPYTDSSENLPGIFNYLINCTSTYVKQMPFPKQYGHWKEGCYLHTPVDGVLMPNETLENTFFKIDVPTAHSVAIVIGETWTQLTKVSVGSWEGSINLEKHWGRESVVAVCANYSGVNSSYSTLLEFHI